MPELPEVETTRRGIREHLVGRRVESTLIRQRALRWPVPEDLETRLHHTRLTEVTRRGKYLLIQCENGGTLLVHLGMSGSLQMVAAGEPAARHDHIDLTLDDGRALRFTDPRRFGCVLWLDGDPAEHALLAGLGPEPLGPEFDLDYLYRASRRKTLPVKSLLMDSRVVVGVGNIYANEALFLAGIHPLRKANRIAQARYRNLTMAVRQVLAKAIEQGGTTLKDFVGGDGKPGYFKQELKVYGRAAKPCKTCGGSLKELRIAQRSTVYCPSCQR